MQNYLFRNNIYRRAVILDPPGADRDNGKRPDVFLLPWSNGKSILRDVTCVDTMAQSNVKQPAINTGSAAERTEQK